MPSTVSLVKLLAFWSLKKLSRSTQVSSTMLQTRKGLEMLLSTQNMSGKRPLIIRHEVFSFRGGITYYFGR